MIREFRYTKFKSDKRDVRVFVIFLLFSMIALAESVPKEHSVDCDKPLPKITDEEVDDVVDIADKVVNPYHIKDPTSWQQYIDIYHDQLVAEGEVEDAEHLKPGYRKIYDMGEQGDQYLQNLEIVEFKCEDKTLIPTHNDMDAKEYHYYKSRMFNHFKLTEASQYCKVWAKTKKKNCLATDTIRYAIISDLFKDNCGNTYRAFHFRQFKKEDESIATLYSLGRTAYPKEGSQFDMDYVPGDTYNVSSDSFFLFARPSEKDLKKIPK